MSKWHRKTCETEPQTFQNGTKMGPRGTKNVKNGAKRLNMEPKWSQRGEYLLRGPLWERKSGQHGRKIGSQIEPQSLTNPCQNRSKERCLSRFIFRPILVDFLMENRSKLAPKRDQKSIGRFTILPYCRRRDQWAAGRLDGEGNG